ncbi:MAG: hypothetical protein ACKOEF_09960 [Acidimicrobiaceae bacterium]
MFTRDESLGIGASIVTSKLAVSITYATSPRSRHDGRSHFLAIKTG